jgi:hypothetical protein
MLPLRRESFFDQRPAWINRERRINRNEKRSRQRSCIRPSDDWTVDLSHFIDVAILLPTRAHRRIRAAMDKVRDRIMARLAPWRPCSGI